MQAVQSLEFSQDPDYELLKSILSDVLGLKEKASQDLIVKFIPKIS